MGFGLTPPLILASVPLVVDLLLDLVGRVVGVDHLDRLPPSLALVRVVGLERETGQQDTERQALGVHTSLHQLLRAGEILVPADDAEGDAHGRDPRAEDDRVAVLLAPFLRQLPVGLALVQLGLALALFLYEAALLGVGLDVEPAGGAVGEDDGCGGACQRYAFGMETTRRAYQ